MGILDIEIVKGFMRMGNPANVHANNPASLASWFVRPTMPVNDANSSCVIFRSLPFQHFTKGACGVTSMP